MLYVLFDFDAMFFLGGNSGELLGMVGNGGELWGTMGNGGELCGMMGNGGELWEMMGNGGERWGMVGNDGEWWGTVGNGENDGTQFIIFIFIVIIIIVSAPLEFKYLIWDSDLGQDFCLTKILVLPFQLCQNY